MNATRVLRTQAELNGHDHRIAALFHCARCGHDKPIQSDGGTGYAYNAESQPICYQCCGAIDRDDMRRTGRATLYLSKNPNGGHQVSNWPGTLRFPVGRMRTGKHNIAGKRYDVWFMGPDNVTWHGVQYGDNTQLCRCKRLKGD